ncbi:MAG: hypothetical protein IKI54_06400 [Lachnospiraceae bacterium]|nr:hypothetical protein [Lachnospiraceae bacterium]
MDHLIMSLSLLFGRMPIRRDIVIEVVPGIPNEVLPFVILAVAAVVIVTVVILIRIKKKEKS